MNVLPYINHTLGTVILAADSFGVGSGPIFLDEVDCSETDSRLLQCNTFTPVGIHSCTHSQDVAILCEGTVCMHTGCVVWCFMFIALAQWK